MEKSKWLFLMSGIAGSGKSTWIKTHLDANRVTVVSRDQIRNSMVPEREEIFSKEDDVFAEFIRQIKEGLKDDNEVVIADATHLNPRARVKVLRALGSDLKGVKTGVVFFKLNEELALKRNDEREGRALVPRSAIRRMACQFEEPMYEEGFDLIIAVDGETSTSTIIEFEKGE